MMNAKTALRKARSLSRRLGQQLQQGWQEAARISRREPPLTPGVFSLADLPRLLGKDNPVILEVGCNNGSDTLEFLQLFPQPQIYAFEPEPRALARFQQNVNDPRVKVYQLAIAAEDGTAEFHMSSGAPSAEWAEKLPAGWDCSGSIRPPKKHLELYPWCKFDETFTVTTKRLDSWCQEEGVTDIDFIWADVQGAEVDMIKGGLNALRRTRYLYTEYNNDQLYEGQITLRQMLGLLKDFRVVHRFADDVLLKNTRLA